MSRVVDQRVVEMQFDNKQFEQNVSTTMSTLEKLKQKLNLTGATKGLENIDATAKKVNIGCIGSAVETVRAKFSALEVMGVTALANITNSAVNAGKRIVSALTIAPVGDGWSEYEMTLNAVQTTMAGTGKTAEEVEKELKKLDEYADKTVYSTADMLNNLPKFTNAGVELESATKAMIGIANATALAGGDAGKASIAFYNLGQAIGTGYLTRMDYNSINNAGIATMEWKEQMVEAAIAAGTLVKAGDDLYEAGGKTFTMQQLFIDGLQHQWATTDVMMKVFGDYGDETTEIGEKAYSAAQDIKTFTQMMESLKATAGTGWKDTWQILFGGLDEAKEFWTAVTNAISGALTAWSDWRNNLLKGALTSKWDQFAEKIEGAGISTDNFLSKLEEVAKENGIVVDDLVEEYGSLIDAIKAGKIPANIFTKTLKKFLGVGEDVSATTDDMTKKLEYFQEVVDKVWRGDYGNSDTGRYEKLAAAGYNYIAVQKLVNKTVDGHRLTLEDLMEVQAELSDEQLLNIGYTEDQVKAIRELAEQAEKAGTPISELIASMEKPSGRELLIDSLWNVIDAISQRLKIIKDAFAETFDFDSDDIYDLIEKIHDFTESLSMSEEQASNFKTIVEGVFAGFQIANSMFSISLNAGIKILSSVLELFGTDLMGVATIISNYIIRLRDWIDENTILIGHIDKIASIIQKVIEGVHNCITTFLKLEKVQDIIERVKGAIADFFGTTTGWLDDVNFDTAIKAIELFFDKIQKWIEGIDSAENVGKYIVEGLVKGLTGGIIEVAKTILDIAVTIFTTFCSFFKIASPSKVFIALGGFLISGLILGIVNGKGKLFDTLRQIAVNCFNTVKGWFSDISKTASGFGSTLWTGIKGFLSNLWTGTKNIVGKVVGFLSKIDWGSLVSIGFGVGMLVLAYKIVNVLKILEGPLEAISGLIKTVKNVIGDLGAAIVGVLKGIKFVFVAAGIVILAGAIRLLAEALYTISEIDQTALWRSVGVLGVLIVALGILAGIMILLSKFGSKDAVFMAAPILAMSASLLIMAYAVKELAKVDPKRVTSTLKLLAGMVIGLGVLMTLFGLFCNIEMAGSMWQAGAMLLGAAAAMYILVKVIDLAGKLDASAVNKGLKVIAGVGVMFALLIKVCMRNSGRHAAQAGLMLIAISGAFLLMIGVIKVASWLNMADVKKGLKVLTVVGLLFTALIAVSNLAGQHAQKAGSMLLMVSVAMFMMLFIIKQAADMSEGDLKKGYAVVAGFAVLLGALIAVSKMTGQHAAKAGVMLLAASGALLIMTGILWLLTKFPDRSVLWESLGALSVMVGLLALLIGITKLAEKVKMGVLITLVVAISILTLSVYALSLMNKEGNMWPAVAALSTLMVAFGILIAVTKYATKVKVTDLLPMFLVIVALTGVIWALMQLPDPTSVLPMVGAISALLLTFSTTMFVFSKAGELVKGKDLIGPAVIMVAVIAALGAIIWGLSTIPNPQTAIQMTATLIPLLLAFVGVTAVLGLLGKGPNSVGNAAKGAASLAIVVGIVAGLMVLIGTLVGLISDEFMSKISTGLDRFVSMIERVGLVLLAFIPVTFVLSKFGKGSLVAAAEGAAALAVVVLILGALAVGIGSLMQLFSDNFFTKIETGLDRFTSVMTKIGEAIGGFVGGVIGGIAEGALAGIGSGLSAFMNNAQDFIAGCGAINEDVLKGAGILTATIIMLSGAELVNSFADLFNFGPGLPMLGLQLSAFMLAAKGFINGANAIEPGSMEGVKTLAEAIIMLTGANLLDGITRLLSFGTSSLATFGSELTPLAEGLVAFTNTLTEGGFTGDAITVAQTAADVIGILAEAANSIPNSGGLLGAIVGNNDIGTWGTQLGYLGLGISSFLSALVGESGNFTDESVGIAKNAAEVIKVLAAAASEIPNSGGWLAVLVGDNDMSTWAVQLPNVAAGIVGFLNQLSKGNFTSDAVDVAKNAASVIVELAKASSEIPNTGGLLATLVGDNDFATWGGGLTAVGEGIAGFIGALSSTDGAAVDFSVVEPAANAIKSLARASTQIDGQADWCAKLFGDNSLASFAGNFGTLGTAMSDFATNLGTFDENKRLTVVQAVNAIKAFATLADADLKGAKTHLEGFGDKLPALGTDIATFCDNMPSADTIDAAISSLKKVLDQIASVASTDISGISGFADSLKQIGTDAVNKFIEAFTSSTAKTDVEKAAKSLADKAVDGIEAKNDAVKTAADGLADEGPDAIKTWDNYSDWKSAGKYLGEGLVEGIKAKETTVCNAAYALGQKAVQGEKDGQESNSPSKATIQAGHWFGEGLVIGIKQMFGQVYNTGRDMGDTATNSISSAISRVADMVNSDIDAQPTIRPVMDLSDVEMGVNAIGNMLDMGGSVGVMANVRGISSMMNSRIQNGSNSDVVSAINKLRKDLGNVGNTTYQVNGITYDDGNNISNAVREIARAAIRERRV